jgi:hypothetical protein
LKTQNCKIAAATLLIATFACSFGSANAQEITPRDATLSRPMNILNPFVVAKARPAEPPYALIVGAPFDGGALESATPPLSHETPPTSCARTLACDVRH